MEAARCLGGSGEEAGPYPTEGRDPSALPSGLAEQGGEGWTSGLAA